MTKSNSKIQKGNPRREGHSSRREKPYSGIRVQTIKGKKYNVVLLDGKIKEKFKFSETTKFYKNGRIKSINQETARASYGENKSLDPDKSIVTLTNVKETTDRLARTRRSGTYQYLIQIIGKGVDISARSQTHPASYPKEQARDEALESAFERLSNQLGGDYDSDEGKQFFVDGKYEIKEAVVWYQAR